MYEAEPSVLYREVSVIQRVLLRFRSEYVYLLHCTIVIEYFLLSFLPDCVSIAAGMLVIPPLCIRSPARDIQYHA